MIEIANQAVTNMTKVKIISEEAIGIREATEKELTRLRWDVYRPKIQEIEHEQALKIEEARKRGEAAEKVKSAEITDLEKVVDQVRRILHFLALDSHKSLNISDDDIQFPNYHSNTYKESMGFLIDDTYLKVKIYIAGNKKPTNKYSIVLLGKCLFYEALLKLDRNYGADLHTHDRYELEKTVKDFPTVEQAKAWLEKNRDKLMSGESRVQYEEVKIDYDKALQTYKVDDFQDLLLARCECGFFYTIWEDYIKREQKIECRNCGRSMTLAPGK